MSVFRSRLAPWVAAAAIIVVGIPLALLYREARRRNLPFPTYLAELVTGPEEAAAERSGATARVTTIDFLEKRAIGDPVGQTPPSITHVAIVDLDRDGRLDVLLCDASRNAIGWIRQGPDGIFRESTIATSVPAPAHIAPSDIDGDGDLDLLVAVMGTIAPNNDKIGA
ncbi:MAG: VCBS repeat-containing protein, partial [Acidobacteria bacterium]|nr:VCBS repeat-containing protein [Acidobacteriota bacterium]